MYTLPKVVVPKISDEANMDGLFLSLLTSVSSSIKKNKPAPFAFFLKERLLEIGDRRAIILVLSNLMEVVGQRRGKAGSLAGSTFGAALTGVNISAKGSSDTIIPGQASNATPKLSRNQKRRQRRKAKSKLEKSAPTEVVSREVPAVKTESISQKILACLKLS
jgi:hypothetical protein